MAKRSRTSSSLKDLAKNHLDKIEIGPVDKQLVPVPKKPPPVIRRQLEKPSSVPVDFKLSTLRALMVDSLEANNGLNAKAVVETLIQKAIEGDSYCMRLLLERVDGLVTKNVNVTGSVSVGQQVTLVDMRHVNVSLPLPIESLSPLSALSPHSKETSFEGGVLYSQRDLLESSTPESPPPTPSPYHTEVLGPVNDKPTES